MRILGSTILENRYGEKYKVTQIIDGDYCDIVVKPLTASLGEEARVKQKVDGDYCDIRLMEVNSND